MSEMSKKARADAKDKVRRLTTDPHQKVDASSWEPSEPLNTEAKTGMRPVSRSARKRGGKIEGAQAKHHAGRKPRKAGGRSLVDDFVNRNVKEANEDRSGVKHDGGMKNGGHVHSKDCKCGKCMGGMARKAGGSVSDGELQGTRPTGGRLARKEGGKSDHWIAKAVKHPGALHRELGVPEGKKIPAKKLAKAAHSDNPTERKRADLAETLKGMKKAHGGEIRSDWGMGERREHHAKGGKAGKGKMSVNIVIAPQGGGGGQGAPHPMMGGQPPVVPPKMPMPPQGMPPGMNPGAPPPMMPPGAGGPPGMPPGAMPPPMMGRKTGGLVEGGAGGGMGRLEKIKDYGGKARELDGHY